MSVLLAKRVATGGNERPQRSPRVLWGKDGRLFVIIYVRGDQSNVDTFEAPWTVLNISGQFALR